MTRLVSFVRRFVSFVLYWAGVSLFCGVVISIIVVPQLLFSGHLSFGTALFVLLFPVAVWHDLRRHRQWAQELKRTEQEQLAKMSPEMVEAYKTAKERYGFGR